MDTEEEVGFLWPLLEAHLGWGVLLWQDASVPSVSLFKSPKQGADVSHGPTLPLFSLETPLNRWGSQQMQESAQTPLFFLPALLFVYSTTRLPFPCPSVLHGLLCCLKLSSIIALQIKLHRYPVIEVRKRMLRYRGLKKCLGIEVIFESAVQSFRVSIFFFFLCF